MSTDQNNTISSLWQHFERTGRIDAYIAYSEEKRHRCTHTHLQNNMGFTKPQ